jgi:cytochrome c oxidase assembly protein subunit 11
MTAKSNQAVNKQLRIMLIVVVGMFAFCFALVPIYSVFCKATGLNGKTNGQAARPVMKTDYSRQVTVELLATLNESIPYEFAAVDKKFTLHPGEYVTTTFKAKNLTNKPVIVQAIPSVTPGLGARHINKVECFCFVKQPLLPNEEKDFPLVFTVDPALPTSIKTLTLAYTLFDVTEL